MFRRRPRPHAALVVRTRRVRGLPQTLLLVALTAATMMLLISSTDALGATLVAPKCDDVNLRTGPAVTYTRKVQVDRGARLTIVSRVSGGSYGVACAGAYLAGHYWAKISAINGKSVRSLYGVGYLYGARKLFKTVVIATPAPTATPRPVVTPPPTSAPPAAPTAPPTTAPDPTTGPDATAAPTAGPTASPEVTAPPPAIPPGATALGASVIFYGRGYGHGVGLSQYGAEGRATDGQLAPDILAHYYQGTTLGTM